MYFTVKTGSEVQIEMFFIFGIVCIRLGIIRMLLPEEKEL
jgi:hypothetical protein